MASLIGGLQSSANPGRNMAPGWGVIRRRPRPVTPRAATPPPIYAPPHYPQPGGTNPVGPAPVPNSTAGWAPAYDPNVHYWGATHPGGPSMGAHNVPATPEPGGGLPQPHGTAVGAAPPVASILSFDQWLATNPQWVQQAAASTNARNQLFGQSGFYQDAKGDLHADPSASPDSAYAQLGLGREQQIGHAAQNAANHGSLFSGGALMGVTNATEAYNAGVARAKNSLLGSLGKVTQSDLDAKLALNPDYKAVVDATKTSNPNDVYKQFQALKPDQAIASIDKYLSAYGKYLTPEQMASFHHLRAVQQNVWNHQQIGIRHTAEVKAAHARHQHWHPGPR